MFSLIKPSTLRNCQHNFFKLPSITHRYVTCYIDWKRNEHLIYSSPYMRVHKNIPNKYIPFPYNQCTRNVHTSERLLKNDQISEIIKKGLSVLKGVDFKDLSNAPPSTLIFGLGGVIPFITAPVYFLLFGYSSSIAFAQLAYGASILAFVGGVKWGFALGKERTTIEEIGLSTIPSLVAWVGLLVPQPLGIMIISSGLGAAVYIDLLTSHYPSWFRALRVLLSSTAIASLLTTLLCSL